MRKKIYSIIDIETTGGLSKRDKITEIGIVLFDGEKIIKTFDSLINPGRSIPPNITRITGITDDMVQDAPMFFEVAKEVVELTEGAIFVAHNVRFDYGFIRQEFKSLGYTFSRRQLDTVRLARKSFPGLRSYSLGNLIKHFNIQVNARHRALEDALATTELLSKILDKESSEDNIKLYLNHGLRESQLPKNIDMETLHNLPEECGVYYFHNEYGKIVYIGKSINIKKRVIQHFAGSTRKAENLQKQVHTISYELTGSELISLILESDEIKKHNPEINKIQKTKNYPYFIHYFYDEEAYLCFEIEKSSIKRKKGKNIVSDYSSIRSAKSHLEAIASDLSLCNKLNRIENSDGPCFAYKIGKCFGACTLEEEAESYNERAKMAIAILNRIFHEDFIIVDEGRENGEFSVVLVEEGYVKAYGFATGEDLDMGIEEIKETLNYLPEIPEYNVIVRNYLLEHPGIKVMSIN